MSTTVKNLISPRSGEAVKNQFTIFSDGVEYFQSYNTTIAKKEGAMFTISSDYDYSVTTSRYFNQWLKEYGLEYDLVAIKKWLKTAKNGDEYDGLPTITFKYVDSL